MAALTPKTFKANFRTIGSFAGNCSNDQIKQEPMLFNADLNFAYQNGGPITRSFIDALPNDWVNAPVVFDSRVHMLMPGWYPAIPGWHHDDVPRPEIPAGQHFITAGQPDYENPRYSAEHVMGLVNAQVCPTHFLTGEHIMPAIPNGELIYRAWDAEIRSLLAKGKATEYAAADRQLIFFDCNTFHTGVKAVTNGWRWFGRISRKTDRVKSITNEIRSQVQVYLEFPMEGW